MRNRRQLSTPGPGCRCRLSFLERDAAPSASNGPDRDLHSTAPAHARNTSPPATFASRTSPLLFPAARGGHIDLEKFRHREWSPGLRAAGVPHRRIYDLRHTYATWSLAAGVDLFTLSRRMGTSLAMIDATYGHLAPDADERERLLLDAYDSEEDHRHQTRSG